MMGRAQRRLVGWLMSGSWLVLAWMAACGGDKPPAPAAKTTSRGAASAEAPAAEAPVATTASAEVSNGAPVPPPVAYDESDFTTSERNRDPFRSFPENPGAVRALLKANLPQRLVAADRFSLDELKLVAIVKGPTVSRVMLVDPEGKGWIVGRGEFIGRPEAFHQSGPSGADYELNWKVDRIREGDVVLIREEPSAGNAPPATRVLALRADSGEELKRKLPDNVPGVMLLEQHY